MGISLRTTFWLSNAAKSEVPSYSHCRDLHYFIIDFMVNLMDIKFIVSKMAILNNI